MIGRNIIKKSVIQNCEVMIGTCESVKDSDSRFVDLSKVYLSAKIRLEMSDNLNDDQFVSLVADINQELKAAFKLP